nr:alpha/beta hydrolase [Pseudomonas sp. CFBP13528]
MDLRHRNNVSVMGQGASTLVFSHGFGCNQAMWNALAPHFRERFRVVLYDLVGAGLSDLSAFDKDKYGTLGGYARDLNEIIDAYAQGSVILVGHSVSAMIGTLADRLAPGRVAAQVMIGPSPCYIDTDGYVGGFKRDDIDDLLDTLDSNSLAGPAAWPR